MFEQLTQLPADPLLGLIDAFNKETRPEKMDLGVGVYKDAAGNTSIMKAVKEAEALLLTRQTTKSYIGSHGDPVFAQHYLPVILGDSSSAVDANRVTLTQAPGGTGALRLALDFIKRANPTAKVWVSNPTWANHQGLVQAAGLEVATYSYVDTATNSLDFAACKADLAQIPAGDVVLLHGCCHNPTGFDLSHQQWQEVLEIIKTNQLLPLIDFAYQGFGQGLDEDAYAVRLFAESLPEVLIASSCSKNFALYRERLGAFIGIAQDAKQQEIMRSHIAQIARVIYSSPPAHGSAVVSTILASNELNQLWRNELQDIRQNISQLRQSLLTELAKYNLQERFACITQQQGMFSFTGLKPNEVKQLTDDYAIYLAGNGRINIAGYNLNNLNYLAKAIATIANNN